MGKFRLLPNLSRQTSVFFSLDQVSTSEEYQGHKLFYVRNIVREYLDTGVRDRKSEKGRNSHFTNHSRKIIYTIVKDVFSPKIIMI